jgi:hypothetical protein
MDVFQTKPLHSEGLFWLTGPLSPVRESRNGKRGDLMRSRLRPVSWPRDQRLRPISSPLLPFLVGGVLLVASVYLTGQILINWDAYQAARPGKQAFPLLLWLATVGALGLGLADIGPRRRYLAVTTPAQRTALEAEWRTEMRLRRAGLPPAAPSDDPALSTLPDLPTLPVLPER